MDIRQKLQMKQQVADKFLEKFQLKPEEISILRGSKSGHLTPVCIQTNTKSALLRLVTVFQKILTYFVITLKSEVSCH